MKDTIICDLDGTIALDKHRNHFLHPAHKEGCRRIPPDPLDERDLKSGCTCGWKRDWDSYYDHCGSDEPNWPVITLLRRMSIDHKVLILTGRIERTREVTVCWLDRHGVPRENMHMRATEDRTQDDKMKIDWAKEYTGGPESVLFVLEDRQRVVDAWRAAGYTCFQVAPGTF